MELLPIDTEGMRDDLGRYQLSVLILDDAETDRMRLARYCRKAGLHFKLCEAEDLRGFQTHIDVRRFDLVLLDYHLAMDTGLDALNMLTAHEKQHEAVAIMVTSMDRVDVAVEAMKNGCSDYLTKEELSVEAVRKSIVTAFERKVLLAALDEGQSQQVASRDAVKRLARACGPELTTILAATIRHTRSARNSPSITSELRTNLAHLETSWMDVSRFMDEVSCLLDDILKKEDASQSLLR